MNNTIKTCNIKDCTEVRQTFSSGSQGQYCTGHNREKAREYWARNRDTSLAKAADYRRRNEGKTFEEPEGYVKYLGFNHPACSPSGMTRYHRIVLWDALEGENAPCDECSKPLVWFSNDYAEALHVDHLNGVKNDNRPENLAPICIGCNTKRGFARKRGEAA